MGQYSPSLPKNSPPPPMAHPPTLGSTEVVLSGIEARQRAAAEEGEGFDNTIKTSPQGAQTPGTKAPTTLLGQ